MVSDIVVLDFENAEVRNSDFESLKPEGWLTGEIINFYWTYLERREFRTEPSILFLGTYTAYRISNAENATITDNISAQLSEELSHRQVILIPLNHRSHWSLLVYCRLTKTFYHYDSISKHNRNFAERAVGRFLRVLEPRAKDGFFFKAMQTPQQNNDFDCGIYVLAIAEELARR
ncbi:cysteine proteinase, partial [Martensiomyces pterosporus]